MIFVIVAIIIIFIVFYSKAIDGNEFIKETQPLFKLLIEDDYEFLLKIRYNGEIDMSKLFSIRIRNGLLTTAAVVLIFLTQLKFLYVLIAIIVGFLMFKLPYMQLKNYYKANLHQINLMLPYYLKSLEILVQHYTVPVALSKSIETAPEVFKLGLKELVSKIDAGDSTVQPYMDFAHQYPVRDSMRMMRLLYRLGLGSQERKQDQLMMFSRTVSTLQNKSREQKYSERLEKMEKRTLVMLFVTGGGIMLLMLLSMLMMMNY